MKPNPLNITSLKQKGLLKPIFQGGILPMFGFVSQDRLPKCYEVITAGGFKPNFKRTYINPQNSTEIAKRITQFSLQASQTP